MTVARASFVSGGSGFIALSYEVLWYRAFTFASGGSPSLLGLLLGFYLLGLALGSFATRHSFERSSPAGAGRRIAALLAVANIAAFLVVPLLARLARWGWVPALGLVAPAAAALGAIFPLVSHAAIRADDRSGVQLSIMYMANIIGSAAGSFLTGFVMLDLLSTRASSVLLLGGGLLLAAVPVWRPVTVAAATVAAALVVPVSSPLFARLYDRLLQGPAFGHAPPIVSVIENRHGVIAIDAADRVFSGGVYDGAFNVSPVSDLNMIERAYAVAAMHPRPTRVLVVGLASVSWAQVIAHLPGVDTVTIVEINPGFLSVVARRPEVASLLRNPRVRFEIDDIRRWLVRRPHERFDLVVMNATFHWRASSSNLLSVEFLQLIRGHLRPRGLCYYNATGSADVERTGAEVFPHALRFSSFIAVSDSPIAFDREAWHRVLRDTIIDGRRALDPSQPRDGQALARLRSLPDGIDAFGRPTLEDRSSILERTSAARIVTDDNMASEWMRPTTKH